MDLRFRFGVIGFLAMIAAVVWLFPTWYPLIDRDSVPNPYPGLEDTAWDEFLSLPPDQQAAYRALRDGNRKEEIEGRPTAALALVRSRLLDVDTFAPESEATYTPPEGSQLLKDGVFTQIDSIRWAQGEIAIYQVTQQRVLRFESVPGTAEGQDIPFSTVRAPDLHVIFTRNPDPLDASGVGVDYIDVGPIKGTHGNQTYTEKLQSIDFNLYPVLAIYSPSLDLVISTATLR
jgi:hypothetical protein